MIQFTSGNIFEDDAQALVNTVNCVGVMGRGIALQFKRAFPENFDHYKRACDLKLVSPGTMFITKREALEGPTFLINFPTKRHWRGLSRIEDIEAGLDDLAKQIQDLGIDSIAIPPLGSGLGGLPWPEVRDLIAASLDHLNADIRVYEPSHTANSIKPVRDSKIPTMTQSSAILILLMDRYLRGFLDPFLTLLELQKLMYFMQVAGQDLKLNFKKHRYGPYALNLRHVLNRIEGYFVEGYRDGGDDPQKALSLIPGALEDARKFVDDQQDVQERFERVGKLVDGFESPFGMELLASVHWLVHHERASDVVEAFQKWNDRKKHTFTPRQITLTQDRLSHLGWI